MKIIKNIDKKLKLYINFFNLKYNFTNSLLVSVLVAFLFFYFDNQNITSIISRSINETNIKVVTFFVIIFCFLCILKYKVFKMVVHPLLNKLDQTLIILLGTSIIIRITSLLGYEKLTPVIFLLDYIVFAMILLLCFRAFIVERNKQKSDSIIVDLNDVLEDKIDISKPFLIRETAVGYDLLSRNHLVDDLVNGIKNYRSDERFVIGIEGKWGSGKTTLINNVVHSIKSDESLIIIDDFDPWISENRLALLNNLLKHILTKSNLEVPENEIDNVIFSISKTVLGKTSFPSFTEFITQLIIRKNDKQAEQTLNDINYMLKLNNKRIVFIIDNLDRLMPSNIFLILNVVQNVLNFSNLVVILSYDKEELEKGLNSISISSEYLEKLVQKKVVIPIADKDMMFKIYKDVVNAIVSTKGVDYIKENLDPFFRVLAENNMGLREFKRFINSAIIPFLNNENFRSYLDTFVIEFVKFSNFQLYNTIYFNSKFFVSIDRGLDSSLSFMDKAEVNKLYNNFFDKFKVKYEYEWDLLELVFPIVKIYRKDIVKNYKNVEGIRRRDSQYIDVQKNKRICSGKYFDLYFTKNNNYESVTLDATKEFVNHFNDDTFSMEYLITSLTKMPEDKQIELMSNLDYFIEELNPERYASFIEHMINNYFEFGDLKNVFALGTKERIAVLITGVLERLDIIIAKEIMSKYLENPHYLNLVSSIINWLKKSYSNDNTELVSYLKNEHIRLVNRIVKDNIYNLYSKELYYKGNAFKLLFVLRDNGEEEKFKEYIEANLNEHTVYQVLNDMISSSVGSSGYTYKMVDNFDKYVDETYLKDLVCKVSPANEQQQFIKEVFDNHLNGEEEHHGERAIRKSQSIKF